MKYSEGVRCDTGQWTGKKVVRFCWQSTSLCGFYTIRSMVAGVFSFCVVENLDYLAY